MAPLMHSPVLHGSISLSKTRSVSHSYHDSIDQSFDTQSLGSGENSRMSLLQESTQEAIKIFQSELGQGFDRFFRSCSSIDSFFDFIANIRLTQMPHHGSRWDNVLKWAESCGGIVSAYTDEVAHFTPSAEQTAAVIWASCRTLLEMGPQYIDVLEKIFGVFDSCGLTLRFFVRHHELLHSIEELHINLASCYADLLKLVTGITVYYSRNQLSTSFSARGFDELYNSSIEAFFSHSDRFVSEIWSARLARLAEPGDASVELIRGFLTPHDSVTRSLTVNRHMRSLRADYTCEWFDSHLTEFWRSKKELMLVTGPAGCGKSVLSEWLVERLQGFKGYRSTEVLRHTIDSDLKTELSTLCVVKGLLLQLLQLNLGDKHFYKSLTRAYELHIQGSSAAKVEESLWNSLENGLSAGGSQTIVIDGIDQLSSGDGAAVDLLDKLQAIISKKAKTKCIVFSRPLKKANFSKYSHFSITPTHSTLDIQYHAESLLSQSSKFDIIKEKDISLITSNLASMAAGSFVWAEHAIEILKTGNTAEPVSKRLEKLPTSLDTLIDLVISSLDLKSKDTKALLAWLLAAERPLLITEVKQLFETDTSSCQHIARTTRIEDDIVKACGPLVVLTGGFVRFTHYLVKQNILKRAMSVTDFKNQGPFPFHIKEAHYDLVSRCVAYIKITLSTRRAQATFHPLSESYLEKLFDTYDLIQYASRYWVSHFEASPMNKSKYDLTVGFKNCFPDSTLLSQIEGACLVHQYMIKEVISKHQVALTIRKSVLGEQSEPVLQNILNLAILQQTLLKPGEVNNFFYEAWKAATALSIHSIANTCAQRYIETTSHITITKKTETVTRRIEVLEYIVNIHRTSDISIKERLAFVQMLVTIYTIIGETQKVTEWQKVIYSLTVQIHGESAPETKKYRELISTSSTQTTTITKVDTLKHEYHEATRKLNVADPKRLSLCWAMYETFEKEKDIVMMEDVLINVWQSFTSLTHTYDVSVQEKKVEVALRYVEFLRKQERIAEAESVLRGIHVDLETSDIQSSTMITYTKTVADQLQSIGSVTAARSVYTSLMDHYVRTGRQETSEARMIATKITEITTTTMTQTTTWDVTTIRETFDSSIINKTTTTIDQSTVDTATTLCITYESEQKWSEVVTVLRSILIRMWPSFSSNNVNDPLPARFTKETMDLLDRLAVAYLKLRQIDAAEMIYRKVFYAVIATPGTSDDLLISTSNKLIDFTETHSLTAKLIVIFRNLYQEIERRHGKTDDWSIKTLYRLGDMSMQVNNIKEAEAAYRPIHTNLTGNSDICHKDAVPAALALCVIYEQQRQYSSALKICNSLWQMFLKHGKEYNNKPDFAEVLYQRYVRIIKQSSEHYYTQLRQLAVDYRKACITIYGASHELTLKATLQLAEIDEDSEEYREEAIVLYEDADSKSFVATRGQISEKTMALIVAAKNRLPHLYSISKLYTSSKAVALYRAEFTKHCSGKGHAHRDTLLWLGHLTTALARQDSIESRVQAKELLQSTIIEVLSHETDSQALADSAMAFASLYKRACLIEEATQLFKQLRVHAVFGASSSQLDSKLKLEIQTWVFLVAFEVSVIGRKELYSSIMADLFTESFLYRAVQRNIDEKASITTVLSSSSRLLSFLQDVNDDAGLEVANRRVVDYLIISLGLKKDLTVTLLHSFLQMVFFNLQEGDTGITVLRHGLETVTAHMSKGNFDEARDLATCIDRFQQLYGGYDTLSKIDLGLRLALVLVNGKSAQDHDTIYASLAVSRIIMQQITSQFSSGALPIVEMPIESLNEACGLLGRLADLENLEWLLRKLWDIRHSQSSWSSSTIVYIGRLLVETQFSRGETEAAIHLCEDMCYNVRRVWGSLDATSIEMQNLLSSFYTSTGNHAKAMRIHVELLRECLGDAGAELAPAEASRIAVQQLNLLQRTYQRLGRWEKESATYTNIFDNLREAFGSEHAWKDANVQGIEKWQAKGADELGVWQKPANFEFLTSAKVRPHLNNLRKKSGAWHTSSHTNGHRVAGTHGGSIVVST